MNAEELAAIRERYRDGKWPNPAALYDDLTRTLAHIDALTAAVAEADGILAAMWSYNEESRANLGHTASVRTSEILRAILRGEA